MDWTRFYAIFFFFSFPHTQCARLLEFLMNFYDGRMAKTVLYIHDVLLLLVYCILEIVSKLKQNFFPHTHYTNEQNIYVFFFFCIIIIIYFQMYVTKWEKYQQQALAHTIMIIVSYTYIVFNIYMYVCGKWNRKRKIKRNEPKIIIIKERKITTFLSNDMKIISRIWYTSKLLVIMLSILNNNIFNRTEKKNYCRLLCFFFS